MFGGDRPALRLWFPSGVVALLCVLLSRPAAAAGSVGQPGFVNRLKPSKLRPGSVVIGRRAAPSALASVPHLFYGSAAAGSGPRLDGELVADGTVIRAGSQDDTVAGATTVAAGDWVIRVAPADAGHVTLTIEDSVHSDASGVVDAGITEVPLDLATPAPIPSDDDDGEATPPEDPAPGGDADPVAGPIALPNTGSGGLGGRGPPALPPALAVALGLAVGGLAVARRMRA